MNALAPAMDLVTHRLKSFDDTEIVFDIYDASSDRVAVIVPGFWRNRTDPSMRRLAQLCLSLARSAVVIDVRGHGESGGNYGFNRFEYLDVAAVVRASLSSLTTASTIDLIGLSMGGAIAISTVARTPELPWGSLLLISAVAEFSSIMPRANVFTLHRHLALRNALKKPRFDWQFRRSEKLTALTDIKDVHVPTCLIHMRNDWLIGHRHSERLFEAANEPKELHLLDQEGAFHADRILAVAGEEVEAIIEGFWQRAEKKAALARG